MAIIYAGADWLQKELDAAHKLHPNKYPEVKISTLGKKVADFLGEWKQGIYHLDHKDLLRADWSRKDWIEISIYCVCLSTHDFNDLTRMVFLAHHMALRVQIEPSTHHRLRIMFHERSRKAYNLHPSLDMAVAIFKSSVSVLEYQEPENPSKHSVCGREVMITDMKNGRFAFETNRDESGYITANDLNTAIYKIAEGFTTP